MIPAPPVTLGQEVFIAWANAYGQERVPCPICATRGSVVLILGSGEHVDVECLGCGLGHDVPPGTVTAWRAVSGVRSGAVTGLSYSEHDDQWHVIVGHDHVKVRDNVLFENEHAAQVRQSALHAEAEAQAERNFEAHFKTKRGEHGWTVRYHRDQIADLRRKLAWHESKLAARPAPAANRRLRAAGRR